MKIKESNVNNQAFFNILSTTILSGINFLTIPIFTRVLGATNYGLYSLFNSWVIILMCVMGLETGSGAGTARYIFTEDYKGYKSSTLFLGTITCMITFVIGIIFRDPINKLLKFPSNIVIVLLICAFSHYVVEYARHIFIYEKRAGLNFVISITLSVLTIGLSLLLIPAFRSEELYKARMYGATIPYVIAAVILWIYIFFQKPVTYKKEYWKYCLTLCIPIVFHTLANDVLKQSDKVMLQNLGFAGDTVGVYSFLCTYTGIVHILLTALNKSWCPFYYDDLAEGAYDRLKKKCKNYLELFTVLTVGFLLVSREVCYLFASEEYWGGMNVIPILVLGIYFIFMYQFQVNFEFFNKQTKIIAFGTISAAIINIVLNLLLIPRFGMYGAATATSAAYGMLFVAHFVIVKNMKKMKFHMRIWDFVPGLIYVLGGCVAFLALSEMMLIRWLFGVILGVIEVLRIAKRKSIF